MFLFYLQHQKKRKKIANSTETAKDTSRREIYSASSGAKIVYLKNQVVQKTVLTSETSVLIKFGRISDALDLIVIQYNQSPN